MILWLAGAGWLAVAGCGWLAGWLAVAGWLAGLAGLAGWLAGWLKAAKSPELTALRKSGWLAGFNDP